MGVSYERGTLVKTFKTPHTVERVGGSFHEQGRVSRQRTTIIPKLRDEQLGTVLDLRTHAWQKCKAVLRRARIQSSSTFVSLDSRLESNKEGEEGCLRERGRRERCRERVSSQLRSLSPCRTPDHLESASARNRPSFPIKLFSRIGLCSGADAIESVV